MISMPATASDKPLELVIGSVKKMTENEFWDNVGRFAEISETPCADCVVERYRREGNDLPCASGCTIAIRYVYKCIKERANDTKTGGKED